MPVLVDKVVLRPELTQIVQSLLSAMDAKPEVQEWCVGVSGKLGTGKTTLFQEFLLTLSERDSVFRRIPAEAKGQSPTYTYLRVYEGEKYALWHVDAYRIAQKIWKEIFATWQEDMSERTHILWVEWFDRLEAEPPDIAIHICFAEQPEARHLTLRMLK